MTAHAQQSRIDRALDRRRATGYRNRRRASRLPTVFARTNAFVPRTRGLCTAAEFRQRYILPRESVLEVRGRELGTPHRSLIMGLLRHDVGRLPLEGDAGPAWTAQIRVSWRDLLAGMGLTPHGRNVDTYVHALNDLGMTEITAYRGTWAEYEAEADDAPGAVERGFSDPLIHSASCTGLGLHDQVRVCFGQYAAELLAPDRLVAVSAATFFRLRTGLARALWPLIDGRSQFWFLHESTIAILAGEDAECMGWRAWQRFRERTEVAFHDMQQAGGLTTWSREEHGRIGRRALRRYVFTRPRLERP